MSDKFSPERFASRIGIIMGDMQASLEVLEDTRLAVPLNMLARVKDVLMMVQNPKAFDGEILHFRVKGAEFRFEWHPGKKLVYIVREPGLQAVVDDAGAQKRLTVHAEPIAYDIGDHGAAQNAVLVYMRGFNEGRARLLNEQAVAKN